MTQNQTIDARAKEIFDELMEELGAPELKTDNIDQLESQFSGESIIDRDARQEHYEAVLEEANRIMELRKLGHEFDVREVGKIVREKALKKEQSEVSAEVESVEEQLDSFDDAA